MAFKDFSKKIVDNITKGLLQNYQNFTSQNQSSWVMGRLNGDGTATLPDGSTVKVITRGITGTYVRLFNMGNGTWLADVPSSGHVQADGFTEKPYTVTMHTFVDNIGSSQETFAPYISSIEVLGANLIDANGEVYEIDSSVFPTSGPAFFGNNGSSMVLKGTCSAGYGGFVLAVYSSRTTSYSQGGGSGNAPPASGNMIYYSIVDSFTLRDGKVIVDPNNIRKGSLDFTQYINRTISFNGQESFPPELSSSVEGPPCLPPGFSVTVEAGGGGSFSQGATAYSFEMSFLVRGKENSKLLVDMGMITRCTYINQNSTGYLNVTVTRVDDDNITTITEYKGHYGPITNYGPYSDFSFAYGIGTHDTYINGVYVGTSIGTTPAVTGSKVVDGVCVSFLLGGGFTQYTGTESNLKVVKDVFTDTSAVAINQSVGNSRYDVFNNNNYANLDIVASGNEYYFTYDISTSVYTQILLAGYTDVVVAQLVDNLPNRIIGYKPLNDIPLITRSNTTNNSAQPSSTLNKSKFGIAFTSNGIRLFYRVLYNSNFAQQLGGQDGATMLELNSSPDENGIYQDKKTYPIPSLASIYPDIIGVSDHGIFVAVGSK